MTLFALHLEAEFGAAHHITLKAVANKDIATLRQYVRIGAELDCSDLDGRRYALWTTLYFLALFMVNAH